MSLNEKHSPNCILVCSNFQNQRTGKEIENDLQEFELLASTLSLSVLDGLTLNLRKLSPSHYYGKGQLESLKNKINLLECRYILFNDEISPSQFKNIQKIFGEKKVVFDRTGVILEIFKNNAKTKESKYQVELASLQYMLPRLTRQWTHLERQMGGRGTRGGPGEKQIEIDRRLIGKRITKLKNELTKIKRSRHTQSASRSSIYRVSIAGYTNAGKSSLLNALCKPYTTYVEDKLFATLDTTTRNISLAKNQNVLITDTVGFIKNLPHDLVASFRSTFEEVSQSNLVVVLVDSSSNRSVIKEHIDTISSTLNSLDIKIKHQLLVFNKIDQIENKEKIVYLKKKYPESVFVSAKNHIMIEELKKGIFDIINQDVQTSVIRIPHSQSSMLDEVYKTFTVNSRLEEYDYVEIEISGNPDDIDRLKEYIV